MSVLTRGFLDGIGTGSCDTSGSIQIEPDRWQLVSIPVKYGYFDVSNGVLINDSFTRAKIKEYVIDQLEYKYGSPANQLVEVCNTYIGDDNFFKSFVIDITNPLSSHNFELVYHDVSDITREEITGFWLKSLHNDVMIIDWIDGYIGCPECSG